MGVYHEVKNINLIEEKYKIITNKEDLHLTKKCLGYLPIITFMNQFRDFPFLFLHSQLIKRFPSSAFLSFSDHIKSTWIKNPKVIQFDMFTIRFDLRENI